MSLSNPRKQTHGQDDDIFLAVGECILGTR